MACPGSTNANMFNYNFKIFNQPQIDCLTSSLSRNHIIFTKLSELYFQQYKITIDCSINSNVVHKIVFTIKQSVFYNSKKCTIPSTNAQIIIVHKYFFHSHSLYSRQVISILTISYHLSAF